ncbi:lanthionine synthetase LanC family protein [Aquimarina algiphila]|uniref:lanthionine synthetase LanC family protein n=1 Tax=Aquimarina algiphila TaxID=2047982 RepID=UPI0024909B8D|nr:lanthionine synthetase LanC family protein [Aquimarina algiphila]
MKCPIIEEDLGGLIFEATLYRYSQKEVYKKKAIQLTNQLLTVFSDRNVLSGFFEGFEGIFYTIQYLYHCKIIEDDSLLDDLEEYLLKSLSIDFKINNFDPLHGSIGKLLYYINSKNKDKEKVNQLVNTFIDSLYNNKKETDHGIFWYDDNEDVKDLVNLGVAHGLAGILSFLLRLKELGYNNTYLDILITGIIKTILNSKNNIPRISNFPDYYSKNINQTNINSRLAWCYGDLGIAYTLLYASKVLQRDDLKVEVENITNSTIRRTISNSGINYYEDYSFFDTGFCHGISGIVFILQKINNTLNQPNIDKRIQFWKKELFYNLEKQLKIKEDIYLPWYRQDDKYSYTLDKESMLNGLCGTGLVLLSLEYKQYDWSDFFMLF